MTPQDIITHFEDEIFTDHSEEAGKRAIEFVKSHGFEHQWTCRWSDIADENWTHPLADEHNDDAPTVMSSVFFDLYQRENHKGQTQMAFIIGRIGNTNIYTRTFEEEK